MAETDSISRHLKASFVNVSCWAWITALKQHDQKIELQQAIKMYCSYFNIDFDDNYETIKSKYYRYQDEYVNMMK